MDLENVIATFIRTGVTVEQFHEFAATYGILEDPFTVDVLHNLLMQETTRTPSVSSEWTEENDDSLLEMLKSPEPATEPSETDEFESWTQDFERIATEQEEMASASLACLRDGEFK